MKTGYILGVNSMWHDASATLLAPDGSVVAAAEEERFSRKKDERRFPVEAIKYCLDTAGITIDQVSHLGLPRQSRIFIREKLRWNLFVERGGPAVWRKDVRIVRFMRKPPRLLREAFPGARSYPRTVFVRHHLAHAASAFYVSPFEEAAYLTVDGMGEWECATWGTGTGTRLRQLGTVPFPHSLGMVYWSVARYLGLRGGEKAGKLMALAAFGEPTFTREFDKIMFPTADGYRIDRSLFDFRIRQQVSPRFEAVLGIPPRHPDEPFEQCHYDVAATVQHVIEQLVFTMLRRLHRETGRTSLCMAGGVALNTVLNGKITQETPFEEVYTQPAADDAGTSLGSACYVLHHRAGRPRTYQMSSAGLGPDIDEAEVERVLKEFGEQLVWEKHDDIAASAAACLADGEIVGWCQGRMEYGPRALGFRSMLADPRKPEMRDLVNEVKTREGYRPVAPAVLEEEAPEWFGGLRKSPFMLLVGRPSAEKADLIPAALHVDGTARVQTVGKDTNPAFHRLISAFQERTGVPVVINTSLNGRGEPICRAEHDTIEMFARSRLDALAIGPYLVRRAG
jgi:carbamoyltransferase